MKLIPCEKEDCACHLTRAPDPTPADPCECGPDYAASAREHREAMEEQPAEGVTVAAERRALAWAAACGRADGILDDGSDGPVGSAISEAERRAYEDARRAMRRPATPAPEPATCPALIHAPERGIISTCESTSEPATWCPVHGAGVPVDGDGLCAVVMARHDLPCGRRATGPGAEAAVRALAGTDALRGILVSIRGRMAVEAERDTAIAEAERLRAQLGEMCDARDRVAMLVPVGEETGMVKDNIEQYVSRLRAQLAEAQAERDRLVAGVDAAAALVRGVGYGPAWAAWQVLMPLLRKDASRE